MSAKNEAFISVTCNCPVCGRSSRHRYIKSKMFSPADSEDDLHVRTYKWENPAFEHIRPNFYHIWHCPFCLFCDEKEIFRGEDSSKGKLELIKEKILIMQRNPKSFLSRVGGEIDMARDPVSVSTAMLSHLQAIFIQQMLSPNNRQFGKLARFYLRTAWLYRERDDGSLPEVQPGPAPSGYPSWEPFLESLKTEWPDIPLTENAAMEMAIECYQKELDRSGALDDIRHEVNVMFVMVHLKLRMQKLDDAIKFVRFIFRRCTQKRQETRNVLDKGTKLGKLNSRQIEQMRNLVLWLNNTIDRCTELSEKVNGIIFEDEYPRAKEVVLKMKEPTVQGILEHLREQSFHEVTCRRIAAMFNKKILEKKAQSQGDDASDNAPPSDDSSNEGKGGLWNRLLGK